MFSLERKDQIDRHRIKTKREKSRHSSDRSQKIDKAFEQIFKSLKEEIEIVFLRL